MKKSFVLLFLSFLVFPVSAQESRITVDASKRMYQVPIKLNGANVEDLNYQCYGGMYSQLLLGQDFEEHIDVDFLNLPDKVTDPKSMVAPIRWVTFVVLDENGKPYLTTRITESRGDGIDPVGYPKVQPYEINSKKIPSDIKPLEQLTPEQQKMLLDRVNGDKQISRYWREINSGSAKGIYRLTNKNTFNGRRDQVMQFVSGTGEVGIDNMGLFRQGINFEAGKNYEGLLRVKNQKSFNLYVAILSSDGKEKLAEKAIKINASPKSFQKIEFELIPKKSDTKGRFAIIIKEPAVVTLGYAFIQPGPWGRVKGGYPIRQDFIDALKANGMNIMRYNGSQISNLSDTNLYRWKYMIGPRDERIPFTGTFNFYASHGFGNFEFLMAAEAAGIDGVIAINKDENPAEIKNMIEYAKGPITSQWGAMRAKDGHPEPYSNLKYIEIHNGAGSVLTPYKTYFEKFKNLATEIWKADPSILLMAPINVRGGLANLKKGDQSNTDYKLYRDFLLWIKNQGKEDKYAQEIHYSGRSFTDENTTYTSLGLGLKEFLKEDIGYNLKLYPMEENGPHHTFERGLIHAYLQNHLNRWGNNIEGAATANLFQPEIAFYTWSQGRIFWDSYRFWNQASGHVDQMFTKEWLPWVLDVKEQAPEDSLDVLVKTSGTGNVMSMYVVNYGLQSKARGINLINFVPGTEVLITQLGPYAFNARNSGENPNFITPKMEVNKIWGTEFTHQFPGHSFTVIRMERR